MILFIRFIIFFSLLISIANFAASVSIQIPDQQAFVNKLFYYRLPNSNELKDIKLINISDVDNSMPKWITFSKTQEGLQIIGLPQNEHKGLRFIHLEIIKNDNTRKEDVFVLNVIESSAQNHECIIKIFPKFTSIYQVWETILSLIPPHLQRKISLARQLTKFKDVNYEDPNNLIGKWSHSLFTITSNVDSDGVRGYQIVIDHNGCNNNKDEIEERLKALGIEYNIIRLIKINPLYDETFDDDQFYNKIVGTESFFSGETNLNGRRMHVKRDGAIHPTPQLKPSWIFSTSTIERLSGEDSETPAARIFPSFSSPTISYSTWPRNSIFTDQHIRNRGHTPFITPEAPLGTFSTPTLSLLFSSDFVSIEPSRLVDHSFIIFPSLSVSSIGPSEFESTHEPKGNSIPQLLHRIPKLEINSGKFWQMKIPLNTFYDREDGDTEKLKLGFYMKNKGHLEKDYWIQFYPDNRYLAAFPPDDQSGSHSFLLEAVDSGGLSVREEIELRVNQHKGSRTFRYNITFYRVILNKYETIVDALKTLAFKVSKIYGDASFDHFTIQSYKKEVIRDKKYWTISWTNDSVPIYPCPKQLIYDLYSKLIDTSQNKSFNIPSQSLRRIANFENGKVILNVDKSCTKRIPLTSSEKPQIRNRIDVLVFELGSVFNYIIPPDTFYAPRGSGTYDLLLKLYTITGRLLDDRGFVKFNDSLCQISGIAVDEKYLGDNEFKLVAQDRENGLDASQSLIIKIQNSPSENQHAFEVSMGFAPNYGDFNLNTRLDIIQKIAEIFGDSNTTSLRILHIEKYEYTIKNEQFEEMKNNYKDNEIRKKREVGTGPFFYEFIWTNSSEEMLIKDNICPSQNIQRMILAKMFGNDSFESMEKIFGEKYRLTSIKFRGVGDCSQYLQQSKYYKDGKEIVPKMIDKEEKIVTIPSHKGHEKEDFGNDLDEAHVIDYYFKTIVPAMIMVLIMILVSCIIMCLLCKYKRNQEKAFDSSPGHGRGYLSNNRGVFKGQRAVIFDGDLAPQHLLLQPSNVVMMPSSAQHLQMRSFNKVSYQPLSSEQRRKPPPYRNK